MSESLSAFAEWLSVTPPSMLIQNVSWIIPGFQSIHILAIAMVMASAIVISLRVLGVMMRDLPLAAVTQRFAPWIWYSLIVLFLTGLVLVVGEPGRSITNSIFQLKMLLLLIAITCLLLLRRPLRKNEHYWDESGGGTRTGAKLIAVVSLAVWSCIIFAGRWIAYAG
jgi:hypothetical protein